MYLGIDIGGTNLKYGILSESNELVHSHSQPTHAVKGVDYVLKSIEYCLVSSLRQHPGIKAVGLGIAGIIDQRGIVRIAPNLPGWSDINLSEYLKKSCPLPLTIENDANIAAIAEMELGAGKEIDNFIYITLGTGVGGTIIFNRSIFKGDTGAAGEIGHIIVDINERARAEKTYRTGILEELIGRNQITTFAREILRKHPNSLLHRYPRPDPYYISEALSKNDHAAIEIFYKIGRYLGIGLASVMNLLDIRIAIVGGGISQAHPFLLDTALEVIKERALPHIAADAELLQAYFTKDAGIVGAALIGRKLVESK